MKYRPNPDESRVITFVRKNSESSKLSHWPYTMHLLQCYFIVEEEDKIIICLQCSTTSYSAAILTLRRLLSNPVSPVMCIYIYIYKKQFSLNEE